ncbi:hypothetical protein IJ114_02300 [Candidatus Saccharibacteria bacterium]|nr:hypothetical protein [Candidatus Saccharibacteria bacterium]
MSKIDVPDVEPTAAAVPKAPQAASVSKSPRPRGRYIDFAPRRQAAAPAAKPAPVSAAAPAAKPAPVSPAARPISSLRVADVISTTKNSKNTREYVDGMTVAPKKVAMPTSNVPLVEIKKTTITAQDADLYDEPQEEIVANVDADDDQLLKDFDQLGTAETEEDLEAALDDFADGAELEDAQEDFIAEEDPEDYVETVLSQVNETRTETVVRRSPFLKNYHIEKRPLSNRAPAREQLPSAEALEPTPHEEYEEEKFKRQADSVPDNAEEPVATKTEKTGSKLGMFITVAITILLGAGVGVFVYLAFFQ